MIKRLAIAIAFAASCAAAQGAPQTVGFGGPEGVIELKGLLVPYHPPAGAKQDQTQWVLFNAANATPRPVSRVLHAGQPPGSGLGVLPKSTRPRILDVESLNPNVVVERAQAYGAHAYLVTIPPSSTASFAVHLVNAKSPPSLLAWREAALAAYNRRLGIFIAAVAGLIAAAAAIAAGLAAMTHHGPPRWAAATLIAVLLARLAATGMFDASVITPVGGPYGLTAMFAGLALAAGLKLADAIAPLGVPWPAAGRWFPRAVIALAVLAVLAYLGVPGAALLTDILLIFGTLAIFGYMIYRARTGLKPARTMMPSAGLFALACVSAAFTAVGGFGSEPMAPDLAGGFVAAGAVLLALAVAAGEGIAVLPFARHAHPAPPPPPPRPAPVPHAAIEAIDASYQGVFEIEFPSGDVVLSREAASLLGLEAGRLGEADWLHRVHSEDREIYRQALGDFAAQAGIAFRIEFRARAEDGRYLWLELRATMKGMDRAERCVGLIADVTARKQSEAALMDRTLRDPLTRLGNRVALMEELEKLGEKLREVSFALLDIDRFKSIHASLGDKGGDEVLASLGERLTRRFADTAQVFRVGGDAFAVLARNGKPEALGAELVATCDGPHLLGGRNVFAPASVGVAEGSGARDPIDLLKNAELALIEAKRHGGDCARVYSREMEALAPADAVALEAELRRALAEGQIEVFYQPILRLGDRSVAGFEALLRWRHPTKGLVEPCDFIAHSEETGLIVALGKLALERAAHDLAQWQRFFPLAEPLFASVNLSRRQFADPDFEGALQAVLGGVSPGTLKLEVTESAVAADGDVRALMERLKALGAGLAIDDFGTGLSSLSQLKDLPFDTVKIDKSFLARHGGSDETTDADMVLASVISLARNLKRSVIVEGVETEADAARLAELGCEYAQGFLFSEPLTSRDALSFIARHYRAGEGARGQRASS